MNLLRYVVIRHCLLLGCLLPIQSFAEIGTLAIPDQNWGITFDAPPLRPVREADSNDHYMYHGNANNFAVSLYVDKPYCNGGQTHEDVLNCAWPKISKDPLINQSSVSKSCNQQYCKVSYDLENTFQDKTIKQKHTHFLFAYGDRWTNLHVSVSNPTEDDFKLLDKFETSFNYK